MKNAGFQQRHSTPSWFWDNLSSHVLRESLLEGQSGLLLLYHLIGLVRRIINLTQLKPFARHGGPILDNLPAWQELITMDLSNGAIESSQSGFMKRGKESSISSTTRISSHYAASLERHLIDLGIYPDGYHGRTSIQTSQ